MATTELVPVRNMDVVAHQGNEADNFMPIMDIRQAIARRDAVVAFTSQIMKKDLDYGMIPGSAKPCLLKAGAEKLCTFFGLVAEFQAVEAIEDWTGENHGGEPLFYYRYKCRLHRNGTLIGEGEGSCSSWESKYRYRWVDESYVLVNGLDTSKLLKRGGRASEFEFAIEKSETTGKYGKPAEYWQRYKDAIAAGTATKIAKKMKDKTSPAWEIDSTQYRVPNPDICDVINTCQKMGQKRSLIAATLIGVNASEYFSQDLEDKHRNDDGYGDPPPPPYDDEPPQQQSRAQAPVPPAPKTHPPQTKQQPPADSQEWVTKATPGFLELKAAIGSELRFAEMLAKHGNGAQTIAELGSLKNAGAVYKKILAQIPEAKRPKPKAEPRTAAERVPSALQEIWDQLNGDIKATIEEFQRLKHDLIDLYGDEDGNRQYYYAMESVGVKHANEFTGVGGTEKARCAAKLIFEQLNAPAQTGAAAWAN